MVDINREVSLLVNEERSGGMERGMKMVVGRRGRRVDGVIEVEGNVFDIECVFKNYVEVGG